MRSYFTTSHIYFIRVPTVHLTCVCKEWRVDKGENNAFTFQEMKPVVHPGLVWLLLGFIADVAEQYSSGIVSFFAVNAFLSQGS